MPHAGFLAVFNYDMLAPHQGSGLFNHDPGGGIGDGENSLTSFSASGLEVILQPIGQLLGDEDNLRLLATFGVPDYEFLVLHIPASKFENLAYPHATPGHEFQHEAVSCFEVLKMTSSMVSFSWTCQCTSFPGRKSFFSIGVSQGFWS